MEGSIAILENNKGSSGLLSEVLIKALGGKILIEVATTVNEAKSLINKGTSFVYFVDSRLTPNIAPLGQEGAEGLELARMIKSKNPLAIVADFSLTGRILPNPEIKFGKTILGDPLALQTALDKLCGLIASQQTK